MGSRVVIDQALLGYDQGHRLLTSSIKLPGDALSVLVSVSDTSVRTGRRLTGLPLPDSELYALLGTWAAPEAKRPGAVWAHALLLGRDAFEEFEVASLARLLHPPDSQRSLSAYSTPLTRPRTVRERPRPPREAILACAYALYASKDRVAHVTDVGDAEAAVLSLWSAQWPALQARYSFAVRSERHRSLAPFDLVVLTTSPPSEPRRTSDARWLRQLADELAGENSPEVTEWLTRFGPDEPPRPASVRALGRLWSSVASGEVLDVVQRLADRYPSADDHGDLKVELFGRNRRWWKVTESRRLIGLLGCPADVWDVAGLDLEERVSRESAAGRYRPLIRALSPEAPGDVRDAFIAGLAQSVKPDMLGALVSRDPQLALDLLAESEVGTDPAAWRGLDETATVTLLRGGRTDLNPPELAAAITAGHHTEVLKTVGVRATLRAVKHVDSKTLAGIAKSPISQRLLDGADPQEVLQLALAGSKVPVDQRLAALAALRNDVDPSWLELAAKTLAEHPDAVDVVFGPLHGAAVRHELSAKTERLLAKSLPKGKDVPQQLRALLLQRARKERWSRTKLAAATRGAGPEAERLLKELGPKDPLGKTIKWLLSRTGL